MYTHTHLFIQKQLSQLRPCDYIKSKKIEKLFGHRLVIGLDIPNTGLLRDSVIRRYVEPSLSLNETSASLYRTGGALDPLKFQGGVKLLFQGVNLFHRK